MPDERSRLVVAHRHLLSNGIKMHIAEAGQGPLVVLLHGFPELWYPWRHQLPALADAGYHAVAPDLRGDGQTDAPKAIDSYRMLNMTADVMGLLEALGEEKAVIVGHDWGANIAWWYARLSPERFGAIVGLSVPYKPHPPESTRMMKQFAGTTFNFALYLQERGVAERELEADICRSLRLFLYAFSGDAPADLIRTLFSAKPADARALDGMPEPRVLPPWLSEADLDAYTQAFRHSGFRGPLNQYRNLDRAWEELAPFGELRVEQPVLFIGGVLDSAVRFGNFEAMRAALPKLRKVVLLPGCGQRRDDRLPARGVPAPRRVKRPFPAQPSL
jgi:pimeloyl-ACP methyl ester carboxylesterase